MISLTDMNNNLGWLTSFVFTLIIEVSWTQRKCTYHSLNGLYGATCAKLLLVEVPQDLITNIKFLDLSENLIQWINATSLIPYSTLVEFKCRWCTHPALSVYAANSIFSHLSYLKVLDLSDTRFLLEENHLQFEWPENLRTLIIDNCLLRNLNFARLPQLEKLRAANNNLEYFPQFHPSAPLSYLDLQNNSLNNMTIAVIQPLCVLEYLKLSFPKGSSITNSSNYCQCKQMEEWIKLIDIKGAFPLNCTSTRSKHCNITFSESILNQRKQCLIRFGKIADYSWIWFTAFITIASTLIVILSIYFLVFLHTISSNSKNVSESPEYEDEEEDEEELEEES